MGWTLTEDLGQFAGAEKFLLARSSTNLSLLVALVQCRHNAGAPGAAPLFGWWTSAESAITGAFLRTDPNTLLLGDMPVPAATMLAEQLDPVPLPFTWTGRREPAEAFATRWRQGDQVHEDISSQQRLYRLGSLLPRHPPPDGAARCATGADRDLLEGWYQGITRGHGSPGTVDAWIDSGGLTLWEVADRPVAMAGHGPRIGDTVRISPIYTKYGYERHGYATAVVSAVAQSLLDSGATDIVHLTTHSNTATFQRLGFRFVAEYARLFIGS
jgi:hypothetical protein